jgi:peptide chain release factor 1
MRALASEEYDTLTSSLSHSLSKIFPSLLVPLSTTTHLSALLELKSGVGGSEASLFLGDLLRVYLRYAQRMRWKADIVMKNEIDNGGIKDAIVEVKGTGAYDGLRWESGVHRVQRVPATETKGRVHTSTVAVLVSHRLSLEVQINTLTQVLPLMEEDAPEDELFSMDDVKIEVMRARGAGGQVNTFPTLCSI